METACPDKTFPPPQSFALGFLPRRFPSSSEGLVDMDQPAVLLGLSCLAAVERGG